MILKNRNCIIFLHHNKSDVTIHNLNLIKKHNPTKNIYTVGFEGNDLIEGSHIVKNSKDLYPSNDLLFNQMKTNMVTGETTFELLNDFMPISPIRTIQVGYEERIIYCGRGY